MEFAALVSRGVPWDKAEAMDEVERMAWLVILGTIDGGEFDWTRMDWKPRS